MALRERAAGILFMGQYRGPVDGRGEPQRLVHVAEFLFDQCVSPRGRFAAGSLSTRRRDMERAAVTCELRPTQGSVDFAIAAPEDDAEIRRLLRENPMRGAISISLEREPDYFKGCSLGALRDITIVAHKSGKVVCVGSYSIRRRFVNGNAMPVGYLGGLRLDRSVEGRFDILRQGYRFFEQIAMEEEAPIYFTSIASDNIRARQFLERNLPGMPQYEFIGEFVTLVIRTLRKPSQEQASRAQELSEAQFNRHGSRCQLATEWQQGELSRLASAGMGPAIGVTDPDGTAGCAILWNQQSFKQTVVRGYSPLLRFARPFVNAMTRLGAPRLPVPGGRLNLAYLSPICATDSTIVKLLKRALEVAGQNGIDLLAIGFDRRAPALTRVAKSFRRRQYHSRIYAVRWKSSPAVRLDDRLLMPEVALL